MDKELQELIDQVPKKERLGLLKDLVTCDSEEEAYALLKERGIKVTAAQKKSIHALLHGEMDEDEIRALLEEVLPGVAVGPAMAVIKKRLG